MEFCSTRLKNALLTQNQNVIDEVRVIISIVNINKETVLKVSSFVVNFIENKEPGSMNNFIVSIINYAAQIQPRARDSLSYLIKFISQKTQIEINLFSSHSLLRNMLQVKGIIPLDQDTNSSVILLFNVGTIGYAIANDDINSLSRFLNTDALIDIKESGIHEVVTDETKITPIKLCALLGSVKCFKFLEMNTKDALDSSVCKYAIAGGNMEIIMYIRQKGFYFNDCAETCVAFHRHDLFDWLLDNYKQQSVSLYKCLDFFNEFAYYYYFIINNNVNELGQYRSTALHMAAQNGFVNITESLINKGCDVNAKNDFGYTPLHYAAMHGQLYAALSLVKKGAKLDEVNSNKRTPLLLAAMNGHFDVALFLVNKRCNINAIDKFGQNALHLAYKCKDRKIITLLLTKGCNPNVKDRDGKLPTDIGSGLDQTTDQNSNPISNQSTATIANTIQKPSPYTITNQKQEVKPEIAKPKGEIVDDFSKIINEKKNETMASFQKTVEFFMSKSKESFVSLLEADSKKYLANYSNQRAANEKSSMTAYTAQIDKQKELALNSYNTKIAAQSDQKFKSYASDVDSKKSKALNETINSLHSISSASLAAFTTNINQITNEAINKFSALIEAKQKGALSSIPSTTTSARPPPPPPDFSKFESMLTSKKDAEEKIFKNDLKLQRSACEKEFASFIEQQQKQAIANQKNALATLESDLHKKASMNFNSAMTTSTNKHSDQINRARNESLKLHSSLLEMSRNNSLDNFNSSLEAQKAKAMNVISSAASISIESNETLKDSVIKHQRQIEKQRKDSLEEFDRAINAKMSELLNVLDREVEIKKRMMYIEIDRKIQEKEEDFCKSFFHLFKK